MYSRYIYACIQYIYIHIYIYINICMCIYAHVARTIPHPDMPNIHNIFANVGHRFGHQSGLDESSGRKSTTFRLRIAFRVYLMFSKIGVFYKILTNID